MNKIILGTILVYKKISIAMRELRIPVFVYTDCKFHPSCSDYAIEAINKYGVAKGTTKAILRILKCSPLSRGGVDNP